MASYAFVAVDEEDTHEPLTYQETVDCEDSSKWKVAMKEEMYSLRKNKTWELVDHPVGQNLVSCKWLFKIKEGIEGVQKPMYKARLVACGFTQRAGIDYNEVFSLVVRHTSIWVIFALTACKDYELEQLDVKTTFLHGNLEEAEIGSTKSLLKKEFDMKEVGGSKEDSWYKDHNGKSVKMPLGGHFKLSLKDCPIRDCDVERMSKVPEVDFEIYAGHYKRGIGVWHKSWQPCGRNGFVDSDYAKDPDREAEYMALTEAVKEAILLRGLLEELGVELNTVAVNYDNQGAIHLSWNHVFHERTKHINVRYHFIRGVLEAKTVKVLKVGTEHNVADALTKVVPGLKLQHCLELLNVGVG
ncbi:retrovirus-related pol polyprotein from transposon TNT 1-94 [Tanacetum coccineum]